MNTTTKIALLSVIIGQASAAQKKPGAIKLQYLSEQVRWEQLFRKDEIPKLLDIDFTAFNNSALDLGQKCKAYTLKDQAIEFNRLNQLHFCNDQAFVDAQLELAKNQSQNLTPDFMKGQEEKKEALQLYFQQKYKLALELRRLTAEAFFARRDIITAKTVKDRQIEITRYGRALEHIQKIQKYMAEYSTYITALMDNKLQSNQKKPELELLWLKNLRVLDQDDAEQMKFDVEEEPKFGSVLENDIPDLPELEANPPDLEPGQVIKPQGIQAELQYIQYYGPSRRLENDQEIRGRSQQLQHIKLQASQSKVKLDDMEIESHTAALEACMAIKIWSEKFLELDIMYLNEKTRDHAKLLMKLYQKNHELWNMAKTKWYKFWDINAGSQKSDLVAILAESAMKAYTETKKTAETVKALVVNSKGKSFEELKQEVDASGVFDAGIKDLEEARRQFDIADKGYRQAHEAVQGTKSDQEPDLLAARQKIEETDLVAQLAHAKYHYQLIKMAKADLDNFRHLMPDLANDLGKVFEEALDAQGDLVDAIMHKITFLKKFREAAKRLELNELSTQKMGDFELEQLKDHHRKTGYLIEGFEDIIEKRSDRTKRLVGNIADLYEEAAGSDRKFIPPFSPEDPKPIPGAIFSTVLFVPTMTWETILNDTNLQKSFKDLSDSATDLLKRLKKEMQALEELQQKEEIEMAERAQGEPSSEEKAPKKKTVKQLEARTERLELLDQLSGRLHEQLYRLQHLSRTETFQSVLTSEGGEAESTRELQLERMFESREQDAARMILIPEVPMKKIKIALKLNDNLRKTRWSYLDQMTKRAERGPITSWDFPAPTPINSGLLPISVAEGQLSLQQSHQVTEVVEAELNKLKDEHGITLTDVKNLMKRQKWLLEQLKSDKLSHEEVPIYKSFAGFVSATARKLGYEDEFKKLELSIGSDRHIARQLEEALVAARLVAASLGDLNLITPRIQYHLDKALKLMAKVVKLQNEYYAATRKLIPFKIKKIGRYEDYILVDEASEPVYKEGEGFEDEDSYNLFMKPSKKHNEFQAPFVFGGNSSTDDDLNFQGQFPGDDSSQSSSRKPTKLRRNWGPTAFDDDSQGELRSPSFKLQSFDDEYSSRSQSDDFGFFGIENQEKLKKLQPGEQDTKYAELLATRLNKATSELEKQLGKAAIAADLPLRKEVFLELHQVGTGKTAQQIIDFIRVSGTALAEADGSSAISASESESDFGEDDEVVVEISVEQPVIPEDVSAVAKIAVKQQGPYSGASTVGAELLSALCFGFAALVIIF